MPTTLPIVLPIGMIAVYGDGRPAPENTFATPSGIILEPDMRMGTVYNIWAGGQTYIYGGDVVVWRDGQQHARVVTQTSNLTYTLLSARLVTVDTQYAAPPP